MADLDKANVVTEESTKSSGDATTAAAEVVDSVKTVTTGRTEESKVVVKVESCEIVGDKAEEGDKDDDSKNTSTSIPETTQGSSNSPMKTLKTEVKAEKGVKTQEGESEGFLVEEADGDDDENDVSGLNGTRLSGIEKMEEGGENIIGSTNGTAETSNNVERTSVEPNVSSCGCDHAEENKMLRKAVLELCERQDIVEEFIEVHNEEKFEKFLAQRQRLVDVMGLGTQHQDTDVIDGKRGPKSVELVGLLKLINAQNNEKPASDSQSSSSKSSPGKSRSNQGKNEHNHTKSSSGPGNSSTNKRHVQFSPTSEPQVKKQRKPCYSCYMDSHLVIDCPYRGQKSAGVQQEIADRRRAHFSSSGNAQRGNQRRR